MTNNPTIDGVSRELLQHALNAVSYLALRADDVGATNAPVAEALRALLDSLDICPTCDSRGMDCPDCRPEPAPAVERKPDAWKCTGDIGTPCVKDSEDCANAWYSHGGTVERLYAAPPEVTTLQSTIAQLQTRIAELESGRGEPVAYVCPEWLSNGDHATHARRSPTETHSIALYAGSVALEKYDDVLLPFLSMMRAELHANSHKGDRPGWLQMDRKTAVLEVFYHLGKLHQAVHRDEAAAIKEYAADVANMCMMLLDVCACLDKIKELNQPTSSKFCCQCGACPGGCIAESKP